MGGKFRAIFYDFDGVMTNNQAILFDDGKEAVIINRGDGLAISLLSKLNIYQAIISTDTSDICIARSVKLGIPGFNNVSNKLEYVKKICNLIGVSLQEVIFVGNDENDISAMQEVGYSVAPLDAAESVKGIANFVTKSKGGEGVCRELYDFLTGSKLL